MKSREILKLLRKAGYSGKRLQEITGLSSGHISKIESDEYKEVNPDVSFKLVKRVCKELDIPIEHIESYVERLIRKGYKKDQIEMKLIE